MNRPLAGIRTRPFGLLLGYSYGRASALPFQRGLARHPWVYGLSTKGPTYAYVMTHVRQDDRVLMYKGFLRAFGLRQDGRLSYLALSDVTRLYMVLASDGSVTSGMDEQRAIGASSPNSIVLPSELGAPRKRVRSLFVVEGEDVANAVFDVLETAAEPVSAEQMRRVIREESAAIGLLLTEDAIDEFVEDA